MRAIEGRAEWMRSQVGRVDETKPALKELEGKACRSCGWPRYYLVLRQRPTQPDGTLEARYSRCHGRREFTLGEIERDLERSSYGDSEGKLNHYARTG